MVPQFWVRAQEGIRGPLSLARIREDASAGILKPDQEVSTDQERWFPAARIENIAFRREGHGENVSQLDEDDVLSWLNDGDAVARAQSPPAGTADTAGEGVCQERMEEARRGETPNTGLPTWTNAKLDMGERVLRSANPGKVRWPAIGLMIAAVLTLVAQLPLFLFAATRLAVFLIDGGPTGYKPGPTGPTPMVPVPNLIGLIATVLIIGGARQMMDFKGYRSAKWAAVLALVPTSRFFVLTAPFGIWALIVLREPSIKFLFEAHPTKSAIRVADERNPKRLAVGAAVLGIVAVFVGVLLLIGVLGGDPDQAAVRRHLERGAASYHEFEILSIGEPRDVTDWPSLNGPGMAQVEKPCKVVLARYRLVCPTFGEQLMETEFLLDANQKIVSSRIVEHQGTQVLVTE